MTVMLAIGVFVIMLLLPILFNIIYVKISSGKTLEIEQSRIRDPRYFVKSFTDKFDRKWNEYDGYGKIILSQEENIIEADKINVYSSICESIVYAEKYDFKPNSEVDFLKEVYVCQNAYLYGINTIRAICGKQNIVLGKNIKILRWIDALGVLSVDSNCDLGVSASSTTKIIIGSNTKFKRLYAPEIQLGNSLDAKLDRNDTVELKQLSQKTLRNLKAINDDLADTCGIVHATIITKHDIKVLNDIKVNGHIRSHKSIWVCDDAIVYGNLFAEGNIYLGQNVHIFGSIFTQENLYAEKGVIIGQYGKIKSVIARGNIEFEKDCQVFGYVGAENEGQSCLELSIKGKEDRRFVHKFATEFASTIESSELDVIYLSLDEFDKNSFNKYRKNKLLHSVVIPEGVTHIHPSFFFECTELNQVTLPSTIEEIGDFAFFGCMNLRDIDIRNCKKIIRIGESAFEGCKSLVNLTIPRSCQQVREGAFINSGLKELEIENDGELTEIESYVFKDCKDLEKINLGNSIVKIGTSTFYGCSSLKEISIPKSVHYIGSYAFSNCDKLTSIRIYSEEIALGKNVLTGLPKKSKLLLKNKCVKNEFKKNIKHGREA